MKITLIFPCVPGSADFHDRDSLVIKIFEGIVNPFRKSFKLGDTNYTPPLSLLMLASVTPKGVDVKIVDERLDSIDFDEDTDLVGITVVTRSAPRAYWISEKFRTRGIPVIMGGIHPSILPQEVLQYADAVVVGEAESVWPSILEDVKSGGLKKLYKGRPELDLDKLPVFNRGALAKPERYVSMKVTTVSRGCPNTCSFCAAGFATSKRYRTRSVAKIVDELISIPGKGVLFLDDNIGWDIEYAKKLMKALIPLRLNWAGATSLNALEDIEFVELLGESGCILINLGFESTNPNAILGMRKQNTNIPARYPELIRRVHQQGVPIHGAFIFGFDEDDKGVFARTADFINEMAIEEPVIHTLMPYPGTRIFKRFQREGRLLHTRWEEYDTAIGSVVYRPKQMTIEELILGHMECFSNVFSMESILYRYKNSGTFLSAGLGTLAGLTYNFYQRRRITIEKKHFNSGTNFSNDN